MNFGRTLFSQVMDFVPWTSFDRLVAKYDGDLRVRKFRCTEQFRAMAFAQLTFRESLGDIEVRSHQSCMAWDFVVRSRSRRWPTRMNYAIGACGMISPLY